MTDIPTTLSNLNGELGALQAELAAATAQGAQAASVAAATRAAASAIQSLAARTQTEAAQVAADGAAVTAAIAARKTALAPVVAAQGSGDAPLSSATAAALKTGTALAKGVSESDLDSKGVAAVTTLDSDIAALGSTEATDLTTARTDWEAKQAALAQSRAAALALLAEIQASAADVTDRLNTALAQRSAAQALCKAADAASHNAAVVAYADYAAARSALASEVSSDPDGTVLKGQWTTAANAWLSAVADAAAAEEAVIEARLALDKKLAERAAKQQTRDADAAAAVAAALP
jgi:hypothetical protein